MSSTSITPVIIVGTGPVGLTLALDLGWRGIETLILEKGDGTIEHPRTGLVAVRTMEFFRRWGMAQAVRDCGFPDDYSLSIEFCTSMTGHLLERDEYPSMRDMPTPSWTPEKKQRCPQQWLDPILKRELARQGKAQIRYQSTVTGYEVLGNTVRVDSFDSRSGEPFSVEGQYLVGCDGAGSAIRTQLAIEMRGNPHLNYSMGILFESEHLLKHVGKKSAERFLFVGPEGTWGNLTVIDGDSLWRLTVYGSASKFDMDHFDAEAWIRRALGETPGAETIAFKVHSVLPWKRTELIADHYGKGRVLLSGDSAHTMSPTGGMGMNTGVADAADLGWKLQATLEGWGGAQLLDSYEAERQPVARRNAAYSTHNFKTWTSPPKCDYLLDDTPEAQEARTVIGSNLKKATMSEWQSWGLQVGYRYEGSPICIPDGTPPTPDEYSTYVPTARPGSRAPHAWLADGRSTLDLFGRGYVLLSFEGASNREIDKLLSAASQYGVPIQHTAIADSLIARLYETPLVLVRPDGHVAWRGDSVGDAQRIVNAVRGAVAA